VTILLGSLVVGIAFGFLSRVRSLYSHGTVNLQNLQDAQLAINSIRRDFFSACPFFGQKVETLAEFQIYEKTRRRVFDFGAGVEKAGLGNNRLILIEGGRIEFHRFPFEAGPPTAQEEQTAVPVQKVEYAFDPARQTLTRTVDGRPRRTFRGIGQALFRLYVHAFQPDVPLLHVTLTVDEGGEAGSGAPLGRKLELATSISSAYVTSSLRHLDWNYEVVHTRGQ